MNCHDVKENLIEFLAAGLPGRLQDRDMADPAISAHLRACSDCSQELESLRKTMALLDEWEAPEPSPYFMNRFRARLREEREGQLQGWFSWLRRPAMALALVTVLAAGALFYRLGGPTGPPPPPSP